MAANAEVTPRGGPCGIPVTSFPVQPDKVTHMTTDARAHPHARDQKPVGGHGAQKRDRAPRFSGENRAGQAGPVDPSTSAKGGSVLDQVEDPGRVLRVLVTSADLGALLDQGGEAAVAERISEAIEKYGLTAVLGMLAPAGA